MLHLNIEQIEMLDKASDLLAERAETFLRDTDYTTQRLVDEMISAMRAIDRLLESHTVRPNMAGAA